MSNPGTEWLDEVMKLIGVSPPQCVCGNPAEIRVEEWWPGHNETIYLCRGCMKKRAEEAN